MGRSGLEPSCFASSDLVITFSRSIQSMRKEEEGRGSGEWGEQKQREKMGKKKRIEGVL
jgi:hypothetical protein